MSPTESPRIQTNGSLRVEIHADRRALGIAAARSVGAWLEAHLRRHGEARVVLACAPSQDEFLAALTQPEVCGVRPDWERITVFHMDEYIGIPGDHPESFRSYLWRHLLSRIRPRAFHPICADAGDLAQVCKEYSARLAEAPIDLICLGIGENGHLAFNDPPVADFADPVLMKPIELDEACRLQQVNDGCFGSLDEVPRCALTVTLPVFRDAGRLSVQVPGLRKAAAVRATLLDPVSAACPATLLRRHPQATLYLDVDSARHLPAAG